MFKETIPEQGGTCNSYRLCAPASDRNAWNNLDAEWKKAVIWHAEPYLHFTWPYLSATDYLDFTRTGDRMRFEKRYFIKRDVLDSLVLAECVEHQGRFMDDIVNGIFAICDESAWDLPPHNNYPDRGQIPLPDVNAPVIDLFACETGAILGAVLYLLKDELDDFSPYVADRIRYELNRRIYEPYLHRYSHWMGDGKNPLNNWTVWCTQNVLLSVFLPDTEKELRKRVVKQACQSVDYWMDQYGEDGCCNEGSSYYHHAGLCLMIILDLLGHTVDPAFFDLARTPKIQNIASYIYKVHVADRYYINYADGSAVGERCGVREFLLAQMTGDRDMQAFAAADYQAGLPETLLTIREHNLVYRLMGGFHAAQMKYYDVSELKNPPDVWFSYEYLYYFLSFFNGSFLFDLRKHQIDDHNKDKQYQTYGKEYFPVKPFRITHLADNLCGQETYRVEWKRQIYRTSGNHINCHGFSERTADTKNHTCHNTGSCCRNHNFKYRLDMCCSEGKRSRF